MNATLSRAAAVTVAVTVAVAVAACHGGGAPAHPRPTTGQITGFTFDRDSGYAVAGATITALRDGSTAAAATTTSKAGGLFDLVPLVPGRYTLRATYLGQPSQVSGIEVTAGEATFTKLAFTPAHPDAPIATDSASLSEILHVKTPGTTALEGLALDTISRAGIAGAVVTAVGPVGPASTTQQVVSDDLGHYRLDTAPGTYTLSAYYSVGSHGQIEVRRADIVVAADETVFVPLLLESRR